MSEARGMRLGFLVTIKGAMCGIHEKDEIIIEGELVNDKKYGLPEYFVTAMTRAEKGCSNSNFEHNTEFAENFFE